MIRVVLWPPIVPSNKLENYPASMSAAKAGSVAKEYWRSRAAAIDMTDAVCAWT